VTRYMQSELFDAARPWLYAAVAGLALCLLAALTGLALCCFKGKPLSFAAGAYALGALGGAAWIVCFPAFTNALGDSMLLAINGAINWGSWALVAALVLDAGLCIYRRVRER